MAEWNSLNNTDAANTARHPENMAPSQVNDGNRAFEAIMSRGLKDTIDGILTTAGSGSAYTATANRSFTASATMYSGAEFMLQFHAASGNSPTLNISTTDARQLRWPDGTTLSASDILANTFARVKYNGSLSAYVLLDAPVPQKVNFGHVINSKSLTTTITGSAFVPIVSKATGETHRFLKAALTGAAPGTHSSAAKAWAKANGAGTAVSASYNLTGVTDNGAGDITFTWATDFSSADYAVALGVCSNDSGAASFAPSGVETTQLAGSYRAVNQQGNGSNVDPTESWFAVAFGEQ